MIVKIKTLTSGIMYLADVSLDKNFYMILAFHPSVNKAIKINSIQYDNIAKTIIESDEDNIISVELI